MESGEGGDEEGVFFLFEAKEIGNMEILTWRGSRDRRIERIKSPLSVDAENRRREVEDRGEMERRI